MSKPVSIVILCALTAHAGAQPTAATPKPESPATATPASGSTATAPAPESTAVSSAAPYVVGYTPPAVSSASAPSPWGNSPYVVGYTPPAISSRAHRGLTLEVGVGAGTTSVDESAASASFAIGLWITRDISLAFRVTEVGAVGFVGASTQYFATKRTWMGAGVGNLSEAALDEYGGAMRIDGAGGFLRAGHNLAESGRHALSISGELQIGAIEQVNRVVGLIAIGYQLL